MIQKLLTKGIKSCEKCLKTVKTCQKGSKMNQKQSKTVKNCKFYRKSKSEGADDINKYIYLKNGKYSTHPTRILTFQRKLDSPTRWKRNLLGCF